MYNMAMCHLCYCCYYLHARSYVNNLLRQSILSAAVLSLLSGRWRGGHQPSNNLLSTVCTNSPAALTRLMNSQPSVWFCICRASGWHLPKRTWGGVRRKINNLWLSLYIRCIVLWSCVMHKYCTATQLTQFCACSEISVCKETDF